MTTINRLLDQLRERVAATLLAQKLWAHYEAATPREQLYLRVLGAFLAVVAILLLVIMPLHRFNSEAIDDFRAQQQTLQWMLANRNAVGHSSVQARQPGDTLQSLANQQARVFGLTVQRYEPKGDDALSITLDNVAFNRVVQWLDALEHRYGIVAGDISVSRRDQPGMVDVRVVLRD